MNTVHTSGVRDVRQAASRSNYQIQISHYAQTMHDLASLRPVPDLHCTASKTDCMFAFAHTPNSTSGDAVEFHPI